MALRKKKLRPELDAPDVLDLAERANRLDSGEILNHMDTTLSLLCKYVPEYRATKDSRYLGEIDLAAQAIYVMARELSTRVGELPSTKPARQHGRHY